MNPNPTELERETARRRVVRYSLIYTLAFGIFAAAQIASLLVNRGHRAPGLSLCLSIVSYAALGFALWRGERDLMQSEDELQQKIRTEALAHALPFTIATACVLMRIAELRLDDDLARPAIIWPWLLAPYTIALYLARRRYS